MLNLGKLHCLHIVAIAFVLVCASVSPQLVCADGYFFEQSSGLCKSCLSSCRTCDSPTTCTGCNSDYELKSGLCALSCGTGCDSCYIKNYCSECKTGFYMQYSSCVQCPSNCDKCNSQGCMQCSSGYMIDADTDTCTERSSGVGGAVGGSLGGCCCCVLLIVGIYCCCKKKNQVQQAQKDSQAQLGDVSMIPMNQSYVLAAPPNHFGPSYQMYPGPHGSQMNPWGNPPPLTEIQPAPFGVAPHPPPASPYSPPEIDMAAPQHGQNGGQNLPPGFLEAQNPQYQLPPGFENRS